MAVEERNKAIPSQGSVVVENHKSTSVTVAGVVRGASPGNVTQSYTTLVAWSEAGLPDPEGTVLEGLEKGHGCTVSLYAYQTAYRVDGNKVNEIARSEDTVVSWSRGNSDTQTLLPNPTELIASNSLVPLDQVTAEIQTSSGTIFKMAIITSQSGEKIEKLPEQSTPAVQNNSTNFGGVDWNQLDKKAA